MCKIVVQEESNVMKTYIKTEILVVVYEKHKQQLSNAPPNRNRFI